MDRTIDTKKVISGGSQSLIAKNGIHDLGYGYYHILKKSQAFYEKIF